MAPKKANTARTIIRQAKVAELLLAGVSNAKISVQISASRATINKDVIMLLALWAEDLRPEERGEWRARHLSEMASIKPAFIIKARQGDEGAAKVLKGLWDLEIKIVGDAAPVKVAPTDPTGENPYSQMSTDELLALAKKAVEHK